jgi:hypothetical protein
MSVSREMQAGVPQGSALSPTLYSMHINDTPQTQGVYLALFAGCNITLTLTLKPLSLQQVCRQTDKSTSEAVMRQLPLVEAWEAQKPLLLKLTE